MRNFGWMIAVVMTMGGSAFADGFRCEGLKYGTQLEVYHKIKPSEGTRNASILVVSDPTSLKGQRTIATFSRDQGLLIQKGATYIARVDSRYKTVKNGTKKIADTTLSELATIQLAVNFNYGTDTPTKIGDRYSAVVTYVHETGAEASENAVCVRYKKTR